MQNSRSEASEEVRVKHTLVIKLSGVGFTVRLSGSCSGLLRSPLSHKAVLMVATVVCPE